MKKVLVVDNDSLILEFMKNLLTDRGYRVIVTEDGLSALDILKSFKPEVIFIDLIMPQIDGKRLCKIIRQQEIFKDVFIAILSAVAAEKEVDPAEIGADVCIAKGPMREMAAIIIDWLERIDKAPCGERHERTLGLEAVYPRGITKELLALKGHFETILGRMSEGVLEMTMDRRIIYANPQALNFIGLSERELVGATLPEVFEGEDRLRVTELFDQKDARSIGAEGDPPVRLGDHLVNVNLIPIYEGEGAYIAILTDVTERTRAENALKRSYLELESRIQERTADLTRANLHLEKEMEEKRRAEEALRKSEEKYRLHFETVSDLIFSLDPDLKFMSASPSVERLLGHRPEELIGIPLQDLRIISRESYERFYSEALKVFSGSRAAPSIYELTDKNGAKKLFEVSGAPLVHEGKVVAMVSVARDVSERKRLENELRQAQKMEAIGTLAGGIAHDFNNILGGIMGFIELSLLDAEGGVRVKDHLNEAMKSAQRAKELVKQILTFTRNQEEVPGPVDIADLARESLTLLRSSLPSGISIEQEIPEDAGVVVADRTQIQQVVMNLCTNAAHAMREQGGCMKVTLSKEETDALRFPALKPGAYFRLRVKDTGNGIHPEVLERIFDPYFTTKPKSEGTGLGLALVRGIVKSYGGAVTVESAPGKGSTFNVYLPAAEKIEEVSRQAPVKQVEKPLLGHERILFVDDERELIEISRQLLTRLGYQVTSCGDSLEALELFKADPDKFDLVITDMTMPRMNGDTLAREMIKTRPDIPVIMCTGYSDLIDEKGAGEIGIRKLIMKPLVLKDMAKIIRKVLDGVPVPL